MSTPARCAVAITLASISEVVVQEIDRLGVVRDDAADPPGGDERRIGLLRGDPCLDVRLPAQIELAAGRRQALAILRL